MSELLVVVVHGEDADPTVEALTDADFRVTRLTSLGGFLGQANATLLVGLEEDREAEALRLIEASVSGREVELPAVLLERLKDWRATAVHHGGATVFVVPLTRILRY